jgi:hypothetical protein
MIMVDKHILETTISGSTVGTQTSGTRGITSSTPANILMQRTARAISRSMSGQVRPFSGSLDLWVNEGDGSLSAISVTNLPPSPDGYTQQTFDNLDISPAVVAHAGLLVVFGFWGIAYGCPNNCTNDWIGIDDVRITCWVW